MTGVFSTSPQKLLLWIPSYNISNFFYKTPSSRSISLMKCPGLLLEKKDFLKRLSVRTHETLEIFFTSYFALPFIHQNRMWLTKRNDLRTRNTLKPSFHISAPIARIRPYRTKQCTGDPSDFMETVEDNLAMVEATAVIMIARKVLCSIQAIPTMQWKLRTDRGC